jgi:Flp pilus assembly protein TadG
MSAKPMRRVRSERGSVLISGLLLTLALLMVLGAAVDIGHAFIVRRDLASIADGAALTGAQQLDLQAVHEGRLALNPEQAREAALATLAANPGLDAQAEATDARVQVRVSRRFPTVLLRLVGLADLTVSAQADAAPQAP